jgi:hypothetical protein
MSIDSQTLHESVLGNFDKIWAASHESSGSRFSLSIVTNEEPPKYFDLNARFKGVGERRTATSNLVEDAGRGSARPVRPLMIDEAALLVGYFSRGPFDPMSDSDARLLLRSAKNNSGDREA